MIRRRDLLAASLLGVPVGSVAAGCVPDDPTRGRTVLRYAIDHDPTCLDPHQAVLGQSLAIGRQLVDSLTAQDPATGQIVGWLASSWRVNEDATRYTFRLRDDATFADGQPVDAAAVAANLDAIADLGARALVASAYVAGYEGSAVRDPRTVTVRFARPNAQFLQATSTPSVGLLSPATLRRPPGSRCAGVLAGSGPFTLASYRPNQRIELRRRAGYRWPSPVFEPSGAVRAPGPTPEHGSGRAPEQVRGIDVLVVPESGVRTGGLLTGQFDLISPVFPHDEQRLVEAGIELRVRAVPGIVLALYTNRTRPPMDEVPLRRALSAAIDRTQLVDTVLGPHYRPATGVLARTTPGYLEAQDELAHRPAAARRLLRESGWEPDASGVLRRAGRAFRPEVIYVGSQSRPMLELVQAQLREVGIRLRLVELQVADFQARLASRDYHLSLQSLTRADPDVLGTLFTPSEREQADPPLRDALGQLAGSGEPEVRAAAAREVQRRLIRDATVVPLTEQSQVLGVAASVRGLVLDASARPVFRDVRFGRTDAAR